jgi:hypothetical protein
MPPPSPKHLHFKFNKWGPTPIGPPPRRKVLEVDKFFRRKKELAPVYNYGGFPFRWTIRKSEKM